MSSNGEDLTARITKMIADATQQEWDALTDSAWTDYCGWLAEQRSAAANDLTTQLAKAMYEADAEYMNTVQGWSLLGWDRASELNRKTSAIAATAALAYLTAAGRLIPAGGMALTAEQVEDVRTMLFTKSGSDTYLLAGETVDRVRALFSATEPAEPRCTFYAQTEHGDIQCNLPDGHAAHHRIDPTPAEPAEEETKADGPRIWGINTTEPSDVQYVRDRFGNLFKRFAPDTWRRWRPAAERFGEADWTWVELASDLPVEVLGAPLELTPSAPAEPAEEETKAEAIEALTEAIRFTVEYVRLNTLPPIEGWSWYDALLKYAPEKAKAFLDAYTPPVNPSPAEHVTTETGQRIVNTTVLTEVADERARQDAKWGEQNHPDVDHVLMTREGGASPARMAEHYELPTAGRAKFLCDQAADFGQVTYAHILIEEVAEVVEAATRASVTELRAELIQVAAVAVAWVEKLDREAASSPVVPAPAAAILAATATSEVSS